MGWTGPTRLTNRQLTDYVVRNDIHVICLNETEIENAPCLSLAQKVFDALSGKIFVNEDSRHFKGGDLSRDQYVEIQEERLGVKLKGTLKLKHRSSGKVIQEVEV